MEECQTPTLAQMMEFKYELTPTMVFDSSCLQDAQNILVNRMNMRCFTPTFENFQSPGLSPINQCTQTLIGGVTVGIPPPTANNNAEGLKKSLPLTATIREEYFRAPVGKPKNVQQKLSSQMIQQQQKKQQKQQQQQLNKQPSQIQQQKQTQQEKIFYNSHFMSDSPPVFTLNSTTISDSDLNAEIISPDSSEIFGNYLKTNNSNNDTMNNNNNNSDSSNSSGSFNNSEIFINSINNNNNNRNSSKINNNNNSLLNRTMNVSTLLRSIGLEQYIEPFEQKNLNLEQFLNIHTEDLQSLGVLAAEHQRIIMDFLSKLNDT